VVELPETFDEVGGAPVLRDQGRPLPVNSLAGVLGYEPGNERVGIVMAVPHPYILGVESVEGTADLVIKPLTAIHTAGITGTARSAEGELVLVVGLSFLLDGCRDWNARPWHKQHCSTARQTAGSSRIRPFCLVQPLGGLRVRTYPSPP
jgi:two-component system chemotaxis sensor kinase CheA